MHSDILPSQISTVFDSENTALLLVAFLKMWKMVQKHYIMHKLKEAALFLARETLRFWLHVSKGHDWDITFLHLQQNLKM